MEPKLKHMTDNQQVDAVKVAMPQTLAGISHELCAPMSGILEMNGLLLETNLTESQRQLAQTVSVCANNLHTIIENAIQSSKIDESEFTLKPEPFDLQSLLHGLVLKQIPAARLAGVDIDISYPDHLPKNFIGDAEKLKKILNHLMGNAVQNAQASSVTVSVNGQIGEADEFHLYLSVKDKGRGLAAQDLATIFEPSQQARPQGDICLSLSRKIIQHMGGDLKVVSGEGQGTVFYITIALPLVKQVRNVPFLDATKN